MNVRPVTGGRSNPNTVQNQATDNMAGIVENPTGLSDLGRSGTFCAPSFYEPARRRFGAGQGKAATTILADQGDYVAVITDVPYIERSKTQTWSDRPGRGLRPMHRSTLKIPTQNYTDYDSTMKKVNDDID